MGVIYDGAKADNELSFTNRVRIIFTASGETDGGLSFGASVRADNAAAGNAGTAGTVFISGAFGTVTMGDVDDAFGALFGDIAGVGLTNFGDENELSSSADGGAFGIPATNALGFPSTYSYEDSFAINPANSQGEALGAEIADRIELLGDIWGGGLFDAGAANTYLFATPLAGAGTFRVIPGAGDAVQNVQGNPVVNNTQTSNDIMAPVEFQGALLAGLTPAPTSELLDGLDTAGATFVLGNVFGTSYTTAGDRTAFLAGTATSGAAVSTSNILLDTSIAVNLTPIEARALYTYALDGFGFALGASQTGDASAYSIAASYEASGFKVALGYARADWDKGVVASVTATGQIADTSPAGNDVNNLNNAGTAAIMGSNTVSFTHGARAEDISLGLSYTMDNLTLAAVGQRKEFTLSTGANIDKHHTYGVSAEYTMDALGVSAYYIQTKSDALNATADNYGIGASYDLGGGASIVGGIASIGNFTGGNDTKADLGVSFSF